MLRVITLLCCVSFSFAADKEDVAKQKAAADETWAKLGLKVKNVQETADVLVLSNLAEAKLKPLAETVQRTVTTARNNLGYAKDDTPFAGKLTLFVFAEPADLKLYIRQVEQRKPEGNVNYSASLRGGSPMIAVSPLPGAKMTDADFANLAATWAGAAVLSRKTGVATGSLPEWLQSGYGKAALVRSEKGDKAALLRGKMKAVVLATGAKAITCKHIWTGELKADADLAAASFAEFLAFGPGEDKFQKFCKSLNDASAKEDVPSPEQMVSDALAACEWNESAIDGTWKQWVQKGSK